MLANGTADYLFTYAGGVGMVNGRAGEPMLGATATAAFFAARNGCGRPRLLADSAEPMGRGSAVAVAGHAGCPPGGDVVQVTVAGGGHEWPPGAVGALGAAAGLPGPASLAELAWAVFAGSDLGQGGSDKDRHHVAGAIPQAAFRKPRRARAASRRRSCRFGAAAGFRPGHGQRRDRVPGFVHAGWQFVRALRFVGSVRAEREFVRAIRWAGFVRACRRAGPGGGGKDRLGLLDPLGGPAQPARVGHVLAAAAQGSELFGRGRARRARSGRDSASGWRATAGRATVPRRLRPRQHRILDRAQPNLPPGREHHLLDQMHLGRVHGLPAGEQGRAQRSELGHVLAFAQDHGPGAQAVAGGV